MNTLLDLAKNHYENFPVGSRFIPKKYQEVIHLVYAFARVADDIADEGSLNSIQRIEKLDEWEQMLVQSVNGTPVDEFFKKLTTSIEQYRLPIKHFQDLLAAFRKDAENLKYETFGEVLEYCKYSANPIGRLMLIIFHCSNDTTVHLSDKICTALQLTNFWQDISVDTRRNRFYIPSEDLNEVGLSFDDLKSRDNPSAFQQLLKNKIVTTEKLFEEGKPLFSIVPKDFRFELKMIWHGGMRVLEKIKKMDYDTRTQRPSLEFTDKVIIMSRVSLH